MNIEEPMLEALRHPPASEERWAAVRSLHRAPAELVAGLIPNLMQTTEGRVLAAQVLGQCRWPDEDPSLPVTLLRQLLQDHGSDPPLMSEVIAALGHRRDVASVPLMIKASVHEDEAVRAATAFALSSLGLGPALDVLVRMANDTSAEVRSWVALGLAEAVSAAASSEPLDEKVAPLVGPALSKLSRDSDPDTRHEALRGWAFVDHEAATDQVRAELVSGCISEPLFEAARILADDRLCRPLMQCEERARPRLRAWRDAVRACCGDDHA